MNNFWVNNFRNQQLVVTVYQWLFGMDILEIQVPENNYFPMSFKIVGGIPTIYILEDKLFANKSKEVRFVLVPTGGDKLNQFKPNDVRFVGTDLVKGGSYPDPLKGQVDWFTAVHCFEIEIDKGRN